MVMITEGFQDQPWLVPLLCGVKVSVHLLKHYPNLSRPKISTMAVQQLSQNSARQLLSKEWADRAAERAWHAIAQCIPRVAFHFSSIILPFFFLTLNGRNFRLPQILPLTCRFCPRPHWRHPCSAVLGFALKPGVLPTPLAYDQWCAHLPSSSVVTNLDHPRTQNEMLCWSATNCLGVESQVGEKKYSTGIYGIKHFGT